MTPIAETQEQLEYERDFLLRSLDDLEAERAGGAIDDVSYRELHDDYTARAAAVIRALRDGVDARPTPPPQSTRRRAATIAAIVGFAAVAGIALAAALGARLPGQTSSGNTPATVSPEQRQGNTRKQIEARVAQDPDDIASRLLLATYLERDGDLVGALQQYDEVVRIDPANADAHAHAGRILYLTAKQAPPDQVAGLVDESKARLDRAIELDPEFADARFFRAIVKAEEYQDFTGAQGDLQRYLVAEPNGQYAQQARVLLAQVIEAMQPATSSANP